jgi:hypothetical protein
MNNSQELLTAFLDASDDHVATRILERLVHEHADPVIKAVVRRKMEVCLDHVRRLDRRATGQEANSAAASRLPPQTTRELDAKDVHATSVLCLLEHLWALKGAAQTRLIQDFRAYVGRIALNAFGQQMRQRYAPRHHLHRKLWYWTQKHAAAYGLALWAGEHPGESLCGFQERKGQPLGLTANYLRWQHDPREFQRHVLAGGDPHHLLLPELVAQVLRWVGTPMNVDDLLNGLTELLGLREGVPGDV